LRPECQNEENGRFNPSLKQPPLAVALWFYRFEFRTLYSCSYHSSNERLIGHFSGRECIWAAVPKLMALLATSHEPEATAF